MKPELSKCHNEPLKKLIDTRFPFEEYYICPVCGRRCDQEENENDYMQ